MCLTICQGLFFSCQILISLYRLSPSQFVSWRARAAELSKQSLGLYCPLQETPWGLSFQCQPSISFFKTIFFLYWVWRQERQNKGKCQMAERLDQIILGLENTRDYRDFSETFVQISLHSISYTVLVILGKEQWHRHDPDFSRPLKHWGYVYGL